MSGIDPRTHVQQIADQLRSNPNMIVRSQGNQLITVAQQALANIDLNQTQSVFNKIHSAIIVDGDTHGYDPQTMDNIHYISHQLLIQSQAQAHAHAQEEEKYFAQTGIQLNPGQASPQREYIGWGDFEEGIDGEGYTQMVEAHPEESSYEQGNIHDEGTAKLSSNPINPPQNPVMEGNPALTISELRLIGLLESLSNPNNHEMSCSELFEILTEKTIPDIGGVEEDEEAINDMGDAVEAFTAMVEDMLYSTNFQPQDPKSMEAIFTIAQIFLSHPDVQAETILVENLNKCIEMSQSCYAPDPNSHESLLVIPNPELKANSKTLNLYSSLDPSLKDSSDENSFKLKKDTPIHRESIQLCNAYLSNPNFLTVANVLDLMHAAEFLQNEQIYLDCQNFLDEKTSLIELIRLPPDQVCRLWSSAQAYGNEELKNRCQDRIIHGLNSNNLGQISALLTQHGIVLNTLFIGNGLDPNALFDFIATQPGIEHVEIASTGSILDIVAVLSKLENLHTVWLQDAENVFMHSINTIIADLPHLQTLEISPRVVTYPSNIDHIINGLRKEFPKIKFVKK
jgi:hypothetical protein